MEWDIKVEYNPISCLIYQTEIGASGTKIHAYMK